MLIIYIIVYFVSFLLYCLHFNIIASGLMIALAIFLYISEYKINNRIVNVKGLFALGFIGGYGLSLLKLSKMSVHYSLMTWLVVFISYFSIYVGSFLSKIKNRQMLLKFEKAYEDDSDKKISYKILERILIALFAITFVSFVIEAIKLSFIPIFTIATPHAYSTFHVYALHYVTSLYIFIPSFAISNYYYDKNVRSRNFIVISFAYVIILAVLMLSRGQLIMSIIFSIFVTIINEGNNIIKKHLTLKRVMIFLVLIVSFLALYGLITVNRAHDVEYLNGIFEMKNANTPIFISQPYMYIAHNFENLNYMINNITHFGFGRSTLVPLFTLTLAKKMFPFTIGRLPLIIKPELSTVTLVYDVYYDFGIVGVIIMCMLIGYVGYLMEEFTYSIISMRLHIRNNYIIILFSLFSYYMLFSFMQSFFSFTDTWFNMIVITALCLLPRLLLVVKKIN